MLTMQNIANQFSVADTDDKNTEYENPFQNIDLSLFDEDDSENDFEFQNGMLDEMEMNDYLQDQNYDSDDEKDSSYWKSGIYWGNK